MAGASGTREGTALDDANPQKAPADLRVEMIIDGIRVR